MRKKILFIFLSLFLVAALGACSKKNDKTENQDKIKKEENSTVETTIPTDKDKKDETSNSATVDNADTKDADKQDETENSVPVESEKSVDMSGDYIGTLTCPEPPTNSTYTIYNQGNPNECIVLHLENIDNGNFQFYITKAALDTSTYNYTENIIFREHIAHYTDSGFYEFIGQEYHLYFKYVNLYPMYAEGNPERPELPADHRVEVYGLQGLFDSTQYTETVYFNDIIGNSFHMNVPFAG